MEQQIKDFVESFKKQMPVMTIKDFNNCRELKFEELVRSHNHEIWQKCKCGNEEDLRVTFTCSDCGAVLFKPSNN